MGRKPEGKVGAGRIGGWRQQHVGRLFLRASRSFAALATRKLKERGHEGLGMAHTALLPHLDAEEGGTRATEIAQRAGMTKQAAGRVLRDLERLGYVERMADPEDARATLVAFTTRGGGSWRMPTTSSARSRPGTRPYWARSGWGSCARRWRSSSSTRKRRREGSVASVPLRGGSAAPVLPPTGQPLPHVFADRA